MRLAILSFVACLWVAALVGCSDDSSSQTSMATDEADAQGADSETQGTDSDAQEADSSQTEDIAIDLPPCTTLGCDYTWESLPQPTYRNNTGTLSRMSDGSLILVGGVDEDFVSVTTVERFDFATGQWSEVAPMPMATDNHQAVALDGNKLLIAGGEVSISTGPNATSSEPQDEVMLYDGNTDTWILLTSEWGFFYPKELHALNRQQVLAVESDLRQATWGIFDIVQRRWVQQEQPDTLGDQFTAQKALTLDEGFLAYEESRDEIVTLAQYDDAFKSLQSANVSSSGDILVVMVEALSKVFLFGGQRRSNTALTSAVDLETFEVEQRVGIESDEWIEWTSAVVLEETLILLVPNSWSPHTAALSLYDASADTWHTLESPVERTSYPPILLDDGKVLIFDGREVWILDTLPLD